MRALIFALTLAVAQTAQLQQAPTHFTSPVPVSQLEGKQAVVETTLGAFVIDLLPNLAPNHVAYFIKLATEGAYDGTAFHAMVPRGIIQGGDPISKDPARRDLYGTGGLGMLRAEFSAERNTRGTVTAVLVPGRPDSAGAQFMISVVDQPSLDGKYSVFGRVVEGMRVVEKVSETPVDAKNKAIERVEITRVTIRDRPPETPEPFSTESVEELAAYRAVLETSLGAITIEFFPQKAQAHVRNFLRLASLGVYDRMTFHRVVRGFVIQTGHLPTRSEPLDERQQKAVRTLQPEFSDVQHAKGVVSMARGEDVASASTSFFICTAPSAALDGKYTAFGRVLDGMKVVEAIEATPTENEKPTTRIELTRVRVEKVGGRPPDCDGTRGAPVLPPS